MVQPGLLRILSARSKGLTIRLDDAGNGAVGRFDLVFQLGAVLNALLDPVAPVAVRIVVLQFVVNDLADQLPGGFRGLSPEKARGGRKDSEEHPEHTHPALSCGLNVGYARSLHQAW